MPVHNYYKSKNNDDLIGFIVTFGYNKCIYDIYESYDSDFIKTKQHNSFSISLP